MWDSRCNRIQLKYPEAELRLAREEFQNRWSAACLRDDSIRFVNDCHLFYPPNVIMKNCREYPFAQDNTVYQIPTNSRNSINSDTTGKPKIASIHPKFRFSHACMQMTESSLTLDDNSISLTLNKSVFYVCDHCPYSTPSSESALNHLKLKKHITCSEYLNSTNPNNAETQSTSEIVTVLRTPRNVYNADGSMPGWNVGDVAVFCPTCFLLLPDKLLCAYHHFSQHPGHSPKFAYGTVLNSHDFFVLAHRTKCPECKRIFPNDNLLLQHWYGQHPSCRSPFYPMNLGDSSHTLQIVDVYCDLCRVHFDRIPPSMSNNRNDRSNSWLRWSEGFCKFCLNHVSVHHRSKTLQMGCRLRIRFVRLDRQTIQTLAAYLYQNDSTLILRFLRECKLLISYLKFCHGGRRSLINQAKIELNKLIKQSQVCVT